MPNTWTIQQPITQIKKKKNKNNNNIQPLTKPQAAIVTENTLVTTKIPVAEVVGDVPTCVQNNQSGDLII